VHISEDIKAIDDAITPPPEEQRKIRVQLKSAIWRYGWPINNAYFAKPCWHVFIAGSRRPEWETCESELEQHPAWGFLYGVWARLKREHLPNATLLGVYANGQTLGQDSPIHRDNRAGEVSTTVVLFCNEVWATCWGGELVFYDNNKEDLIKSVLPKPGR